MHLLGWVNDDLPFTESRTIIYFDFAPNKNSLVSHYTATDSIPPVKESLMRRLLPLVIVCWTLPSVAWAYAEVPFALGWVIANSENILVIKVIRLDKEKKFVAYEKEKDLLGVYPHQEIKVGFGQIMSNSASKAKRDEDLMLASAEPGRRAVLFCSPHASGFVGYCYTGHWWYDCYSYTKTTAVWRMRWGAPMLCWGYCGTVDQLIQVAPDVKSDKEVTVAALRYDSYKGMPVLEDWLLKRQATRPAIWRIKAGLKIRDYPRSPDSKLVVGLGTGDVAALPRLLGTIKGSTGSAVIEVMEELGQIGPEAKECVPLLLDRLNDPDNQVRMVATESLLRIAPDQGSMAVPALKEILKDEKVSIRRRAAESLGQIGLKAEPAAHVLAALTNDADLGVRRAAAWALLEIGQEIQAAVPVLAQELKRDKDMKDSDDWRIRRAAAQKLEGLGVKARSAAPALAGAMENDDYLVSQCASRALLAMGPDAKAAVPTLIWIVTRELTPANEIKNSYMSRPDVAATILGQIGPAAKDALPALEDAAKDRNEKLRAAALDALKRIKDSPNP